MESPFQREQLILETGGRPSRKLPTKDGQKQAKPRLVQFINTIHPDDATSSQSIRLIRSQAARHSRGLQRKQKQNQLGQSQAWQNDQHSILPNNLQAKKSNYDEEGINDFQNMRNSLLQQGTVAEAGFRRIAPKQTRSPVLPSVALNIRARLASPIQLIGGAQKDAYQGLAISLSDDEQYLFDFYLKYVLRYAYNTCYKKENEASFHTLVRESWVPFALTKPSLMAAIFHVACRNYVAKSNNAKTNAFAIQKLQYRVACLNMAQEAITTEVVATDTTIALALMLASESYYEGDMNAYMAHGNAIMKMVTARGGLDNLGISGFLTLNVASCIYDPMHHIVIGPEDSSPRGG